MTKKLLLLVVCLFSISAFAQSPAPPDCSKGFCAGIGSPMSPHISCKAGYKYSQLDAPGTNWSCTGIPPDWVQDAGGGGGNPNAYPVVNVGACDGSDFTSKIQSALNTSGSIHVVIPYSPNSCVISDVLLVHSNTWLDVDPNTTIYEASGNNVEMLRNTNLSQSISDNNITVTGGIWDDNWVGNPGVASFGYNVLRSSKSSPVTGASGVLGFFGVQFLAVRNVTVVNANIFSIQFAQCQDFHVSDIKFVRNQATISDGIHVNGPSARFDIKGIYGTTGDDLIALNAWDWTISTPNNTEGDITDGQIDNVRPASVVWAMVKMSTGTSAGVYRVSINDVKGSSVNGGFIWGTFPDQANAPHTTTTGTIGGIRATNVAISVSTASTAGSDTFGSAAYIACNAQDVTIDGAVMDSTHMPATGSPFMRVKAGMTATSIGFGPRVDASTPTSYLADIFGAVNHFSILSGSDIQGVPGSSLANTIVNIESGGSVTYLDSGGSSASTTLMTFLKFQEGTGTASSDSSNSGNNVALTGTTWAAQAGLISGGLTFAGTSGSHADPAGNTNIAFERTQPFSISTWFVINPAGVANPRIIANGDPANNLRGYEIGFNFSSPNWLPMFALYNNSSTNALQVHGATSPSASALHNMVFTYDGSSTPAGVKMYLDGAAISTFTDANTLSATTVSTLAPRIGGREAAASCSTCYFEGTLGPLAIWNRVLSAGEVAKIFANPYTTIN